MAEENTATSAHLDSYMHVYNNGTTARLHVTPWDRNTVADGNWQTVNTIQPLINRDIYLADCIDKLAEKYTVYTEGQGIKIEPNQEPEGTYTIRLADDYMQYVPSYTFDESHFNLIEDPSNNTTKVGFKIASDSNKYLYADNSGLHANVNKMMYDTSAVTSHSAYSANYISAYTYTYHTEKLNFTYTSTLPETASNTLYIIG